MTSAHFVKAIAKFCWHLSWLVVVVGQNNKLCWLLNTGAALSDAGTCLEYDSRPGSHTWCQLISVGQWSVVSPHLLIPVQAHTSSHHLSLVTSHRRVHSLDEDCICCACAVLSPVLCLEMLSLISNVITLQEAAQRRLGAASPAT